MLASPEQTATVYHGLLPFLGVTFQETQTDCVQDTAQRMKLTRLKASTALMTRQTDAEQRRPTIKKLEVKQVEFKLGEDCWDIQDKRMTVPLPKNFEDLVSTKVENDEASNFEAFHSNICILPFLGRPFGLTISEMSFNQEVKGTSPCLEKGASVVCLRTYNYKYTENVGVLRITSYKLVGILANWHNWSLRTPTSISLLPLFSHRTSALFSGEICHALMTLSTPYAIEIHRKPSPPKLHHLCLHLTATNPTPSSSRHHHHDHHSHPVIITVASSSSPKPPPPPAATHKGACGFSAAPKRVRVV
ncbi:hypothetical protein Tco_1000032 [Tanacetum coccineum]